MGWRMRVAGFFLGAAPIRVTWSCVFDTSIRLVGGIREGDWLSANGGEEVSSSLLASSNRRCEWIVSHENIPSNCRTHALPLEERFEAFRSFGDCQEGGKTPDECCYLAQSFNFGLALVTLVFQVSYFVSLGKRLPNETCNLSGEGFHFLCLSERSELGRVHTFSQLFPG